MPTYNLSSDLRQKLLVFLADAANYFEPLADADAGVPNEELKLMSEADEIRNELFNYKGGNIS